MSTYKARLPGIFPHVISSSHHFVREMVAALLSELREDVEQGSSFAVTVDNWDGTWNLWLSEVSWKFVVQRIEEGH